MTFRVALNTVNEVIATDAELDAAYKGVASAGGTDISVMRGEGSARPRVEFHLEAENRGHAVRLAEGVLDALSGATRSLAGGWILSSVNAD